MIPSFVDIDDDDTHVLTLTVDSLSPPAEFSFDGTYLYFTSSLAVGVYIVEITVTDNNVYSFSNGY